jgi:AICAR transformylase/IMP cyclohydrolase PurH
MGAINVETTQNMLRESLQSSEKIEKTRASSEMRGKRIHTGIHTGILSTEESGSSDHL